MFDIYTTTPYSNALQHNLIAGNYQEWAHVLKALAILHKINGNAVYTVAICKHRKSSLHFKTNITHTAPITAHDLKAAMSVSQ